MYSSRTTWAVVLSVVLGGITARAQGVAPPPAPETPSPPPPRTGWRVQGLPLLNFNSDEGLGYGARLMLVDAGDGTQAPYRHAIIAQFFQTTRGNAVHRLMLDAPTFLESRWRLGLDVSLLNDRFSPYYGQGGAASFDQDFAACDDRNALEDAPDVCPGNPAFRGLRYYNFEQRTLPSVVLNARRPVSGPWQVSMGYRFRMTRVATRYDADALGQSGASRLEEDIQAGRVNDGGPVTGTFRTAELTAGLLLDLRDNEPAPIRGMFHELAVRGAAGATGSSFNYWGATANFRFYHPLGTDRLVAALRLMGDVMGGNVPFYLLSSFGGVEWRDGWGGVGGVFTARGILKHRLQGEVKALVNGELRWQFLSVLPLKQRVDFTLVAFLDAGRAWSDLSFQDRGMGRYAGGGGLRVAWEKNFIVRMDYGVSPQDGTTGFYLDFNHLF
ncbi:Omp85 family outer membrane protein [Corallococcus macrosporus]|uniref:Omp85 family outer membrane protein n=1 Tax=Corallococcus macrosporus TaxID=35 RepID=UPI0005BDB7B9|nr:BamA/TamA family outer membrane protein [Corallococcus macrosporus]